MALNVRWWLIITLFALPSWAQQTLFNVPSTQETVPGRLFGQVQMAATPTGGELTTTLELGLFPWLEVGMNVARVRIYSVEEIEADAPATSSALLNTNVYFKPTDFMAIEIGGQGGAGIIPRTSRFEPVLYGYATARFDAPGRWGSYVVGGYVGTRGALGFGPPAGGLLGLDVPLWEHHIHAQADWVIGLNSISVAVVGAVIFIGRNFQLSAGAQLPSPGTSNAYGGILELTWVPSPGEKVGSAMDRTREP